MVGSSPPLCAAALPRSGQELRVGGDSEWPRGFGITDFQAPDDAFSGKPGRQRTSSLKPEQRPRPPQGLLWLGKADSSSSPGLKQDGLAASVALLLISNWQ